MKRAGRIGASLAGVGLAALFIFFAGAAVRPDRADGLVSPVPILDPALESQLDAFIKETLDGGARSAPARVRGALILGGEAAAGEIPTLTRSFPICTSVGVVACIGGAGYVGWKIGGALNRWLGISASFLPPYNVTAQLSGAWWRYATDVGNFIQGAPHAPGRNVRAVTSGGVDVDVARIDCNASRTGPGTQPCSEFYRQFALILDAQPGAAVRWGTGTQACGYGTCYAKYKLADEFLSMLNVVPEPYVAQRIDWADVPPTGAGTITAAERTSYRNRVRGDTQSPAPENYVGSVLDPENWYPPTEVPGENGGVRTDWAMPNCVGLAAAACKDSVTSAALAAHAYVLPSLAESVHLPSMNLSYPATAVLTSTPAAGASGKFSSVLLVENPDPLPILIPFAEPFETYPDYVARIRNLGWLGTAVTVNLTETNGDPAYGSDGVPCRNLSPSVRVDPSTPLKLYRNPLTFSGSSGGSSSSWDCRGDASVPGSDECEYDEYALSLDYDWEVGRRYAQATYDDACSDAWAYFHSPSVGGFSFSTSQRESHTGRIKDQDVAAFLTSDGSDIDDWEKAEWGPFTITSQGQQLTFVVHAYRNPSANQVRSSPHAKIKFRTEISP